MSSSALLRLLLGGPIATIAAARQLTTNRTRERATRERERFLPAFPVAG